MLSVDGWKKLLEVTSEFQFFEESVLLGNISDYRQIKPEVFSLHGWDMIANERIFNLLLPFIKQQLKRAQKEFPSVYPNLNNIRPEQICSFDDWHRIPILVKDSSPELGLNGFRDVVNNNPKLLCPEGISQAWIPFGSGGSLGKYTPTFVTLADREREVEGWRRGHNYHGLKAGDTALYTYNTTHKGGQWMQESLLRHGVNVLIRRTEEGPKQILDLIRDYGVNILFTVQQPFEAISNQAKASGVNLYTLVMESLLNPEYRGLLLPDINNQCQIKTIFLGGFEIVSDALSLADEYLNKLPLVTLLGSSEAIPQACSTNPCLTPGCACHHNNLHLLQGPHYVEIVKRQGESFVPVQKGEEGILVYTSCVRDGTVWIRYAPGDVATLLLNEGECTCGIYSPVITNVHRKSADEQVALLANGCAAG